MTFLNASLIFGIAAVSLPIALHLIARREPRRVVFPSIRLLTQRFESNRSRLRVRRWWLLALRIAALAAFALALARPAIDRSLSITWLTIAMLAGLGVALLAMASVALARDQSRTLAYSLASAAAAALVIALLWAGYTYASGPQLSLDRGQPAALAIVLDNSPTSAWKSADDDRLQRMQEIASAVVARLPATSRIAIVDRSVRPVNFALDVAGAINRIEQLQPLEVTQPLASRLDAALRLVRSSELSNRQVLLISDLTRASWDKLRDDPSIATRFAESPEVPITLFDLGDFQGGNRSLSLPMLADGTPPRNKPVPISTTLRWNGEDADNDSLSVTAELQLFEQDPTLPVIRDGDLRLPATRSVDRTSVQIIRNGSSNLLLTAPPLEVGTHHGRIRLVGEDPLGLDDTRYFTLRVMEPVPILLVADNDQEARVIRLAMSDEFAVEQVGYEDITVVRLADYPAIVAVDPPRDVLEDVVFPEYVQTGGDLLVCLGPAAGDEPLTTTLLPRLVRRWRPTPPGTFFQLTAPGHPLLAPLAEISGGVPWANFRVGQYWQVDADEEDAAVLIRYAGTEHAALTERQFAGGGDVQGRLLTLTTPLPALAAPARAWNELFSGSEPWPAFLLVRQFAEYLTGRGDDDPTTVVGQPQLIRWRSPAESPEPPAETRRLQLFAPGSSTPVPLEVAGDRNQVVIREVPRAGTYWLRGTAAVAGFSANLPESASRLERISEEDVASIFGPDAYTLVRQRDEIELSEGDAKTAVSLHSPILLLALLAFLLEQILGNRFYRARAGHTSTTRVGAATA